MITIVSGIPRSGTSMMMQMLAAGGLPPLMDRKHIADRDNPKGYFEFRPIRHLHENPLMMLEAEGKAIKVISPLLDRLPRIAHEYRVILMRREWSEVCASQDRMLKHRKNYWPEPQMADAYEEHMREVERMLEGDARFGKGKWLKIDYGDVIINPPEASAHVCEFLQIPLNLEAMAAQVEPMLYRNRAK